MKDSPTLPSLLLMGTSNSGKTPLGNELCQTDLVKGKRFLHLDFGELLRLQLAGKFTAPLTNAERCFLSEVMNGRLLDDAHFGVARKIIEHFLVERGFDVNRHVLVLNGIPRHCGQAIDCLDIGIDVRLVVALECTARIAVRRKLLSENGAGHEDRSHRDDGAVEIFRRKNESYNRDTLPLLDFYDTRKVPVRKIHVGVETAPAQMVDMILPEIQHLFCSQ